MKYKPLFCLLLALTALLAACGTAQTAVHEVTPQPAAATASVSPAPTTTPSAAPSPAPSPTPSPAPTPAPPPPETPAPPPAETPTILTPDELGALVEANGDDLAGLLEALEGVELDLGYTPDANDSVLHELPDACRFLLPDGLREGDFVQEALGGYDLYLSGRTPEDFDAIVENARGAGFEGLAVDAGFGIRQFEGYRDPLAVEILYSAGTIIIGYGYPDAGIMSG